MLFRSVLSHNFITTTKGLDKLLALSSLDIGWNKITDYLEVSRLAKLPCLENIRLEGNPIYEKVTMLSWVDLAKPELIMNRRGIESMCWVCSCVAFGKFRYVFNACHACQMI